MPIDYSILSLEQAVSGGIVLLIILICSVRSLMATYQEKVQTRIMLRTLLILEAGILLLLLLQPPDLCGGKYSFPQAFSDHCL